jgi:hypothetical protein
MYPSSVTNTSPCSYGLIVPASRFYDINFHYQVWINLHEANLVAVVLQKQSNATVGDALADSRRNRPAKEYILNVMLRWHSFLNRSILVSMLIHH